MGLFKKKKKGFRVLGWSISFGIFSLIALFIFFRAMSELYKDFFTENAMAIALVSGILVLMFIITGIITVKNLTKRF